MTHRRGRLLHRRLGRRLRRCRLRCYLALGCLHRGGRPTVMQVRRLDVTRFLFEHGIEPEVLGANEPRVHAGSELQAHQQKKVDSNLQPS